MEIICLILLFVSCKGEEMKKKGLLLSLCCLNLITANLNAEEVVGLKEDTNITKVSSKTDSRKDNDVQFAIEMGAKTDFWNPGLSGNVLKYDAEGLFLGFGKLKVKFYDSDVFTIEKYGTLTSSDNQDNLLAEYKSDKKQESTIDGMRISLQLIKVINFLFDKEWLDGLNYEYNTRNFIGSAKLLQNSVYWYGKTNGGIVGQDFSILERGNNLSFKTKFTSHKLSYDFNNILKNIKGSYISFGIFDEEWSKPTFVGDTGLNGELPVVFDSNYYSKGISGSIGLKDKNYDVKAYFDYGIDNEMKIIQKGDNYANYNQDIDMYAYGLKADYRFVDIYNTNSFATDIIIGAGMQYNQITQNGDIEFDAETLYGVNAGIEITF